MVESVELQKLGYFCNKKRRSEKVFVRLKILRTCQTKIVCELIGNGRPRNDLKYIQVVDRIAVFSELK